MHSSFSFAHFSIYHFYRPQTLWMLQNITMVLYYCTTSMDILFSINGSFNFEISCYPFLVIKTFFFRQHCRRPFTRRWEEKPIACIWHTIITTEISPIKPWRSVPKPISITPTVSRQIYSSSTCGSSRRVKLRSYRPMILKLMLARLSLPW